MPFEHTPYDGSSRPFSIGLAPLDLNDWIEPDAFLARDLAAKDELIRTARDTVFRAQAGSRDAQAETLELLAQWLPQRFPALYHRDGRQISVAGTGRTVDLDGQAPLLAASRLVQEDLCLMQNGPEGWRLGAASLCFPSTWSLGEKIGRDMGAIHADVPGFAGRMGGMVSRIFDHLRADQPVWRLNWSIYGDSELHHPEAKSDALQRFPVDAPILERATIRVERQTLRRLPTSGAILFTIRVFVDPLREFAAHPQGARNGATLAAALREQLQALTPEQCAYKGLTDARERLSAALAALAGEH